MPSLERERLPVTGRVSRSSQVHISSLETASGENEGHRAPWRSTTHGLTLVMGASMVMECIRAREECRLWLATAERSRGRRSGQAQPRAAGSTAEGSVPSSAPQAPLCPAARGGGRSRPTQPPRAPLHPTSLGPRPNRLCSLRV